MNMMPSKIRKPNDIAMIGSANLMSVTAIAIAPHPIRRTSAPTKRSTINVIIKLPKR